MPDPLREKPFLLAVASTTALFLGFYLIVLSLPAWAASGGAAKSGVGLVVGIMSVSAVVTRLSSGPLLDGPARRTLLLSGLVLVAATAAAMPLVHQVLPLSLLRVLQGVGWGWSTTVMGALVNDLVPHARRGEALGVWGLAPTISMAVGPLLAGALLARFGAANVFHVAAVLVLLALLLALPIQDPAARCLEDGSRAGRAAVPPAPFPTGVLLPCAALLLSSLSYGAIVAFVPVELAATPQRSGLYFTVFALAILVSRPFAGRLSDRRGRAAVIVPGLVLGALGTALTGWVGLAWALPAAAALYGLGTGGLSFPALMALALDRAAPEARGRAMALFYVAYDLAIAGGAIAFGPFYERFGFAAMSLAASCPVALSVLLFVPTRRPAPESTG